MAFDGAFTLKIVEELKTAIDSHIDKIYQPSRDEMVFLLRKKGFQEKLFISTKSGSQRVHFTQNKYENPATPPMFCMLMRKYLLNARLVDIIQPPLERVVIFVFSATSEMGDIVEIRLVCELIGGKANIILVGNEGKIIDALKRSDVESATRLILPGAKYQLPEKQEKLNPLKVSANEILKVAQNSSLLKTVDGFSPLICREIEGGFTTLEKITQDLKSGYNPTLILDQNGTAFDFTFTPILQYGPAFKNQRIDSFSLLLDKFYTEKENCLRINSNARDILRLINNLKNRTQKKLSIRLYDLEKCKNRETLRIYGELIKANLFSIQKGASFAEVPNYYSENLETIRIPLDISLSPQSNANKYFKEYKKTYTAEQTLKELTQKDREELAYFDTVLDSIERATELADIAQIREELSEGGYIKTQNTAKKQKHTQNQFKEYESQEGYKILVGKNNKQNDILTTSLASKQDLWFHVKNIAGSHVVVFCGGNEVSQETILKAATLAAENSKARNSSNVAVDYTPIKYVKKPHGAKAGMVIYTTNKTIYVTPKGENL
ncbi:MAG: fibronectin/fibrinogen-binding protein [Ruminococcaceae bacterium]|nr:fibronectin/fibrinogen-binding protein [Oscillospiraceae bacterium]